MLRSALRSARGALRVEDLDHEETEDVNEGDGDHGGVGEFNNTERDDENGDLNEIAAANNHAVQSPGDDEADTSDSDDFSDDETSELRYGHSSTTESVVSSRLRQSHRSSVQLHNRSRGCSA